MYGGDGGVTPKVVTSIKRLKATFPQEILLKFSFHKQTKQPLWRIFRLILDRNRCCNIGISRGTDILGFVSF